MHIHNFGFVRTLHIARKRSEQKSLSVFDSLSALNPAQFPLRCLFELYRELEIFTSCMPQQKRESVLSAERKEEKYDSKCKMILLQELQMQLAVVKRCLRLQPSTETHCTEPSPNCINGQRPISGSFGDIIFLRE